MKVERVITSAHTTTKTPIVPIVWRGVVFVSLSLSLSVFLFGVCNRRMLAVGWLAGIIEVGLLLRVDRNRNLPVGGKTLTPSTQKLKITPLTRMPD